MAHSSRGPFKINLAKIVKIMIHIKMCTYSHWDALTFPVRNQRAPLAHLCCAPSVASPSFYSLPFATRTRQTFRGIIPQTFPSSIWNCNFECYFNKVHSAFCGKYSDLHTKSTYELVAGRQRNRIWWMLIIFKSLDNFREINNNISIMFYDNWSQLISIKLKYVTRKYALAKPYCCWRSSNVRVGFDMLSAKTLFMAVC